MEPLYEFVKGVGWTIRPGRRIRATIADCDVWIIDRKPKPGEVYKCYDHYDYLRGEMGTHDNPNLQMFAEILSYWEFDSLSIRSRSTHDLDYVYVVIEKCS